MVPLKDELPTASVSKVTEKTVLVPTAGNEPPEEVTVPLTSRVRTEARASGEEQTAKPRIDRAADALRIARIKPSLRKHFSQ
jgi:hypothetical protein